MSYSFSTFRLLSLQNMSTKKGANIKKFYNKKKSYDKSRVAFLISDNSTTHWMWTPRDDRSIVGDVCSQTHLSVARGGGRGRYHLLVQFFRFWLCVNGLQMIHSWIGALRPLLKANANKKGPAHLPDALFCIFLFKHKHSHKKTFCPILHSAHTHTHTHSLIRTWQAQVAPPTPPLPLPHLSAPALPYTPASCSHKHKLSRERVSDADHQY